MPDAHASTGPAVGRIEVAVMLVEVDHWSEPCPRLLEILGAGCRTGEGIFAAGGITGAVLLPAASALQRAEDIVEDLARHCPGSMVRAGVAAWTPADDTASLLRRARQGLRRAHQNGRCLVVDRGPVAGPGRDPHRVRAELVADRVRAELVPVVELSRRRQAAWLAAPQLSGRLLDDAHTVLAELGDAEVNRSFDRVVLASALAQYRSGPELDLYLPVNSSSTVSDELVGWLSELAAGAGVRRERIVVAIHEAELATRPAALGLVAAARGHGLGVALRGVTGSRLPLAALVDLSPELLLLGGSAIRGDDSRLLPALLSTADEIGATAIATGVTSENQVEVLRDYECRLATGPLFGS